MPSNGWKKPEMCPICKKEDKPSNAVWCTLSADGTAACCMRIESERRMANGGWLHRLSDTPRPVNLPPPPPKKYIPASQLAASWVRWEQATTMSQLADLANSLGVSPVALKALGACWAWPHEAWGFPMYDANDSFCGMRLRNEDGDKWALRGSRQGVFVPCTETQEEAVIVEGPTDCAAAVSLGYFAIGRPSCTGGLREIAALCVRLGVKRLSVIADKDGPGIAGAKDFCRQIKMPHRLAVLPAKDLRAYVKKGATRAAVDGCLSAHMWEGR